jgi:hypothetical protein
MGGTGKKNEHPGKNERKPKPPPASVEDDDIEDGDIATPSAIVTARTISRYSATTRSRHRPAPISMLQIPRSRALRRGCHAAPFMDK